MEWLGGAWWHCAQDCDAGDGWRNSGIVHFAVAWHCAQSLPSTPTCRSLVWWHVAQLSVASLRFSCGVDDGRAPLAPFAIHAMRSWRAVSGGFVVGRKRDHWAVRRGSGFRGCCGSGRRRFHCTECLGFQVLWRYADLSEERFDRIHHRRRSAELNSPRSETGDCLDEKLFRDAAAGSLPISRRFRHRDYEVQYRIAQLKLERTAVIGPKLVILFFVFIGFRDTERHEISS